MRRALLAYIAVGAVALALAYALGPRVLQATFGADFDISAGEAALLTLSAVLIALATHVSLAFIAVDRHRRASEAWGAAVLGTVVVLLLPLGVTSRLIASAVIGPVVCLVVLAIAWSAVFRSPDGVSMAATTHEEVG